MFFDIASRFSPSERVFAGGSFRDRIYELRASVIFQIRFIKLALHYAAGSFFVFQFCFSTPRAGTSVRKYPSSRGFSANIACVFEWRQNVITTTRFFRSNKPTTYFIKKLFYITAHHIAYQPSLLYTHTHIYNM